MTTGDTGESCWCTAPCSPGLLWDLFPLCLSESVSCEGHKKRSSINRLTNTMAAFTASCAISSTSTPMVARPAWQRQGISDEMGMRVEEDMDQNTILDKTHEFFQMCDIENKGFITRRDMQVRLLLQGYVLWTYNSFNIKSSVVTCLCCIQSYRN